MRSGQSTQIIKKLAIVPGSLTGSLHKYAEKIRKKRNAVLNQEFLLLQTIAIVLVVIGHEKQGALTPFSDWFPIYSYHMPLFVFISGYFYKQGAEQHIFRSLVHKARRLLIPYFIWNLVYGLIILLFQQFGWIEYGQELNLYNLFVEPWVLGKQFEFNRAAWFVPTLFLVQAVYILFQLVFSHVKGKNWLLFLLFTFFGCGIIWYSNTTAMADYVIVLGKILFFSSVLSLGVSLPFCFRKMCPPKIFFIPLSFLCLTAFSFKIC